MEDLRVDRFGVLGADDPETLTTCRKLAASEGGESW
jgi:hypothetical protein